MYVDYIELLPELKFVLNKRMHLPFHVLEGNSEIGKHDHDSCFIWECPLPSLISCFYSNLFNLSNNALCGSLGGFSKGKVSSNITLFHTICIGHLKKQPRKLEYGDLDEISALNIS